MSYTPLFHNLCSTTPKEVYEEMKMVSDYNTRCSNKFLRIEIGIAPQDEKRLGLASVRNLASNFAIRMGLASHQWGGGNAQGYRQHTHSYHRQPYQPVWRSL